MKRSTLRGLLLLPFLAHVAGAAVAGPETIATCQDDKVPVIRWSPPGADTVVCHQRVFGAGLDQGLTSRDGEMMAALKNNVLVGVRPGDEATPGPLRAAEYQPGDWLEKGSTGVPGELWWGRTADRHIFVGQESPVRLRKATTQVPAAVRPALQDFHMRRMMALVQKKPMVAKPGDERFKVFPKAVMNYGQHAATMATFDGGLGGDGKIPPGQVSNARLELATSPGIKGTLQFDLVIDGQTRHFSLPVAVESEEQHLRATQAGDPRVQCNLGWEALNVVSRNDCVIPNGATFKEMYDATGAFFGDQAALAAVHFKLRVNSPSRHRTGANAIGVIVLKVQ
ncbi:hypothetical protein IP91_03123 [Pseudoduganella lurida]|uniref:Uncharacterized protein n=1 Tax=Pseudoduganella lurida TaxID=1036180 RepID=A0A562R720_9BURK|nr:hypothetical protein [Pseudoduganella lurida]TWI64354.1 hypothetical protein IP91_03123 [Pseudoduganella lurida]